MRIVEFLRDRKGHILFHILFIVIASGFLILTGTSKDIMFIVLVVYLLALVIFLTADYIMSRNRVIELEAIMEGLDKKYLFAECVSKPKNSYEKRLMNLTRRAGKSMIEAVSNAELSQREYREYIESWVHEIKAPITAAELICQGMDSEERRKLMPQLTQIESHVERALFYARAESIEKDFMIRQSSLDGIVANTLERHRILLIQSGVRVETQGLDKDVYTDHMWAQFILGQILQNAVRYRSENPFITISGHPLGNQMRLKIKDNGIGIPSYELTRIFERGFTGSNGRSRGGATGMGLYICRRLARFLEIHIEAESIEGQGTTMILTFPAKDYLTKT